MPTTTNDKLFTELVRKDIHTACSGLAKDISSAELGKSVLVQKAQLDTNYCSFEDLDPDMRNKLAFISICMCNCATCVNTWIDTVCINPVESLYKSLPIRDMNKFKLSIMFASEYLHKTNVHISAHNKRTRIPIVGELDPKTKIVNLDHKYDFDPTMFASLNTPTNIIDSRIFDQLDFDQLDTTNTVDLLMALRYRIIQLHMAAILVR